MEIIAPEIVKNRPFIVVSIMLATIMQALDTTIANVALPHMQGSLAATQDQIAWVLTSYIVAAAIMTPPAGFLAAKMGRKKLFIGCVTGFTLSSIFCGMAMTLPEMVLFRLMQGVFGAGLVPLSQAVLLDIYPRKQHGQAMALWGVGVMLGPILGPTLGGWLTEYYNWRWVFYINVPVGIIAFLGMTAFLPDTPRNNARKLDVFGFSLLAVAIGALQLMLDRGQNLDWFNSMEVKIEAVICFLSFYLFMVQMFTAKRPFVEPAMFRDRNYVASLLFMFVIGVVLLGSMALLPPFLTNLMGYPVITTGIMLAPRGVGTMAAMLLVGRLIGRIDVRALLWFGLSVMGFSLWQMTQFNTDVSEWLIFETGVIQGFGMGFVFVPLSTMAYATLDSQYRGDATAFFSLIRNIGGSIGISVLNAVLASNTQVNHANIAAHLTKLGPLANMTHAIDATAGVLGNQAGAALEILNGMVTRQASVIAFLNDFRLMAILTFATIPLVFFLRKPDHEPKVGDTAAALE